MAIRKAVLVLHGYSQNATIFSKRLGALRKECKDIDLVFLDAPHRIHPADIAGSASQATPNEADAATTDPSLLPRAWWSYDAERTRAIGLEESLLLVRDVMKDKKFDGIIGFSQGAAFAAVIAALLEKPSMHPPFLIDGQTPHPPLQFCIAVSGFKVRDPLADRLFLDAFATPTLHVIGRADVIVVEERSKTLINVSSVKRVEVHDGGHYVPSKGNWRKFLVDYMRDPTHPHHSPDLSSRQSSETPTPEVLDTANL